MLRLTLLFALSIAALPAASPTLTQPESVGMSTQRLSRIGRWLDGIIERKEAAGFVTIVARRGKVVHHEARGTRGLTASDPMPLDAIFDVASMTKPITVVAALMLLEKGAFALEDPISEYLPEFESPKVQVGPQSFKPAEREITVLHLFTHTSGIRDPRPRVERFAFPTLEEYVKDASKLPLQAQPGSRFLYGSSHDVLGYLVQVVSGKPLDQFVEERILKPLDMSDTHYWPPASKDSRRAVIGLDGKDVPASAGLRGRRANAAREGCLRAGRSDLRVLARVREPQSASRAVLQACRKGDHGPSLVHSGIRDPRPRVERFAFPTLEEYVKDASKLPLQAQPGSRFLYGSS